MKHFYSGLTLAVLMSVVALSGCANRTIAESSDMAAASLSEAEMSDMTTKEIIDEVSQQINDSDENLAFYSPLHIDNARKQLAESRKLLQLKVRTAETDNAAKAAAILAGKYYQGAVKNKVSVQNQLVKSLKQRDVLLDLNADEIRPRLYAAAMESMKRLILEIEGGNLDKVIARQPALQEQLAMVEAETMKTLWLEKARNKLKEAQDNGAEKFAVKTWEQAVLAIERASQYTDRNYRDREGVKQISAEAFVRAATALNVALEVQKIAEAKAPELEQYVLDVQALLNTINQEVGIRELSSYSFYEQARLLTQKIEENRDEDAVVESVSSR
ncbi:MAG TPA: hypothetical protein DEA26_07280 [Oceanospirillales bacterium]|nr:hypothetical protein [Oceanospirillaceae bacterium]HBS42464.1 hypothetical protein [Oceanospirillales bacterium]|tara:strand:- start:754 stop:1743 length:990 start_codon:yes stop_codon:yes gene_type:complete